MAIKKEEIILAEDLRTVEYSEIGAFQSISKLIDLYLPVGSIYTCSNDIDPSSLFGGTWVRLKDRLLRTAGDSNEETQGGYPTARLSSIPGHNHNYTPEGYVNSNFIGEESVVEFHGGNHSHRALIYTGGKKRIHWRYGGSIIASNQAVTASTVYSNHYFYGGEDTDYSIIESSEVSLNSSYIPEGSIEDASLGGDPSRTGNAGKGESGDPFSIIPSYKAIYVWERIS